jgi:hypothetical protein
MPACKAIACPALGDGLGIDPNPSEEFMRTAIIILGGIVLLGLFAVVGWWLGNGPRSTMAAAKLFIPVWLAVALINMWVGVSRAGYSISEELPIFLVIFAIPAAAAAFVWWRFS